MPPRPSSARSPTDATHNCWAWRIGGDYRSSDDGEPAGTAGRPILAAIDGQGFDRVMVVVTRWFGGIKLGAGGLVRAYGGAAAECLRTAPRVPLVGMRTLVLAWLRRSGQRACRTGGPECRQAAKPSMPTACAAVELPADQVDALKIRLRDATRDRIRIQDPT
jgi:hypothetical protein